MEQAKKLQTLLDAQIGKGHIFNIVTAMQSQDKSLDFVGAAGIADPQTSATMRPDTPYFIASVTKMYTAAIILRLHQEKRIKLDAPISQYLPASLTRGIHIYKGTDYSDQIKFPNYDRSVFIKREITLSQNTKISYLKERLWDQIQSISPFDFYLNYRLYWQWAFGAGGRVKAGFSSFWRWASQ